MQDTLKTYNSSYLLDHLDTIDVLPYREISFTEDISAVFGSSARVVQNSSVDVSVSDIKPNQNTSSEAICFTILVVMMAFYVGMLALCSKGISSIFKSFSYQDVIEKLIEMYDVNMERLLQITHILVYIMIAYAAMMFFQPYFDTSIEGVYLFFGVLVVGLVYSFYNFLVVKFLKYISDNEDFFEKLNLFNRSAAAITTIILLPIVVLISFTDIRDIDWLAVCLVALVGIFVIHYLIILFLFFRRENVSFLEYILYLCGAEIVPISFVIIFVLRNYTS